MSNVQDKETIESLKYISYKRIDGEFINIKYGDIFDMETSQLINEKLELLIDTFKYVQNSKFNTNHLQV